MLPMLPEKMSLYKIEYIKNRKLKITSSKGSRSSNLNIQNNDDIEDPNNVTCERKWNFRGTAQRA